MKEYGLLYYSIRSDIIKNTVPEVLKYILLGKRLLNGPIFLLHSVRLSNNMSILGPYTFKNRILQHLRNRISTIQTESESNIGNKTFPSLFSLIYLVLQFNISAKRNHNLVAPFNIIFHGSYHSVVRIVSVQTPLVFTCFKVNFKLS